MSPACLVISIYISVISSHILCLSHYYFYSRTKDGTVGQVSLVSIGCCHQLSVTAAGLEICTMGLLSSRLRCWLWFKRLRELRLSLRQSLNMKTSLILLACLLAVAVAQRDGGEGGRPGGRPGGPRGGEWGGGVDNVDNVDPQPSVLTTADLSVLSVPS